MIAPTVYQQLHSKPPLGSKDNTNGSAELPLKKTSSIIGNDIINIANKMSSESMPIATVVAPPI